MVGILIGAMLPFLFSALTMLSVGRSAEAIILQVRMQFYDGTCAGGLGYMLVWGILGNYLKIVGVVVNPHSSPTPTWHSCWHAPALATS